MKLNIQSVCALVASFNVAQGAPVEMSRRQTDLRRECPTLLYTANTSAWNGRMARTLDYEYIMRGHADMQPLAQIVVDEGTHFEEYIEDKIGNFVVLDNNGMVDPFYSMIWKLNALTAPILMAPYQIERTNANSGAWDEWWDALQDLTPADEGMEALCSRDAQDKRFKPWAVTFPSFMDNSHPINDQYRNQTADYAMSRVWEVQTHSDISRPDTGIYVNTLNQCVTTSYSYSETITEETGASADHQYSDSTTNTRGIEIGASASAGFMGMGAEISTTISAGVERTAAQSTTQGTTETVTFERQVEFEASPLLRRNAILNVTVWTDQTEADIWFTGDIVYDPDHTGIQAWIQGNGRVKLGPASQVPDLLYRNKLATPGQIRHVAELAMNVIGAEWSESFLNSLVSPSVAGLAKSVAGNNVFMEMWECDRTQVPNRTCNEALAQQFPPALACDDSQDSRTAPEAILDHLDSECYTMEPVDGHKNRWVISSNDSCRSARSASDILDLLH
eukprot:Clim_evm86s108 gene=Clim_evmTU86s108